MGKAPSSKSQSYSGSSNPAFLPFAKDAIGSINSAYGAAQPVADEAIQGVRGLSGGLGEQYASGRQSAGQAQGYWGDVLSGKYLNGNPYMTGMLERTRSDVSNDVNSQAARSGRYGSDMHQGALSRELANAQNQMLYGDYDRQMNRMDGAATSAYGANSQTAQQQLMALTAQGEMPYTGMQAYGNSLGAIFNGGQDRSKATQAHPAWAAAGQAASAAAMMSDRRLKRDIIELGIRPDGLTAVEWTYRDDMGVDLPKGRFIGVIADEVKAAHPEAYIANFNGTGFAGVNYAALGTPMLKVA